MFILLFLLTCFLCVYEDNQSTTLYQSAPVADWFFNLYGDYACIWRRINKKADKCVAFACGWSLSEWGKDGRLQSKRPELLSPPEQNLKEHKLFLFISECDCIYITLQPRDCHSNMSLFFVVHAIKGEFHKFAVSHCKVYERVRDFLSFLCYKQA